MENLIVIGILLLAVGSAIAYIVKKKKSGAACIGCSCAGTCGKEKCDCNHS